MESSEFPPNSEVSKRAFENERNVERVTTSDPIRKKRSLRKQFKEFFFAGDAKTAVRYAVLDVALPEARDWVLESLFAGLEMLFKGDSRRRRGSTMPQSGPYGHVNYSRYSQPSSRFTGPQRAMSRLGRARHDFDEIVLDSRVEADEVIERLFDLVSRYDTATVADLYDLVGFPSNHVDQKWGWTDLRGAGVSRYRDGYLLDLPEPQPL